MVILIEQIASENTVYEMSFIFLSLNVPVNNTLSAIIPKH